MARKKSRTCLGGRKSSIDEARSLIALWSALEEGASLDPEVVSQRLGVDEKSSRRLLELLATARGNDTDYLPLYYDDDEAITLAGNSTHQTSTVGLTANEFAALTLALNTLGVRANDPLRKKLEALIVHDDQADRDAAEISSILAAAYASPDSDALLMASKALAEGADLSFSYQGTVDRNPKKRLVRPIGISHKGNAWYLEAYDYQRQSARTFRIDRITEVKTEGRRQQPTQVKHTSTASRQVKLEIHDRALLDNLEWPGIRVLREDDDVILATIPYYEGSSTWLVRRITACGGLVRTTDDALRRRIKQYANELLKASQDNAK